MSAVGGVGKTTTDETLGTNVTQDVKSDISSFGGLQKQTGDHDVSFGGLQKQTPTDSFESKVKELIANLEKAEGGGGMPGGGMPGGGMPGGDGLEDGMLEHKKHHHHLGMMEKPVAATGSGSL